MLNRKNKGELILWIAFACLVSIIKSQQLISIGKLTVVNHTQSAAVNKTITLTPLSYHEHLPNLEMLHIRVLKANPFDGCTQINFSSVYPSPDRTYPDTFLLIDGQSGACNYWKKAEFAKEALVKGVIIIDDDPEKNANRPSDVNNGLFLTFLIRPSDAKLIMPGQTLQFQAKLSISEASNVENKKKIYLWLSSLNSASYDFLNWWNQTLHNIPQLQKKVVWEPKYVFYGKSNDENKYVYSCACNGLFCSPQFHGKTSDVLIKQDLRQKIIFKDYPEKYLKYIQLFSERCLENYLKDKYVEQCSRTQMNNIQINESRINKEIETFLSECDKDNDLFGELLTDKGRFSMIGSYPVILLNRQILQVNNQNELQATICRKFSLQESQGCIKSERTTIQEIVVSIVFFLLILAGLFGVGFFVVMCYKNRLRKQMHKQVKMQVSTAVQHYFQLSQQTSAKN